LKLKRRRPTFPPPPRISKYPILDIRISNAFRLIWRGCFLSENSDAAASPPALRFLTRPLPLDHSLRGAPQVLQFARRARWIRKSRNVDPPVLPRPCLTTRTGGLSTLASLSSSND
jgi:hypothetical protein